MNKISLTFLLLFLVHLIFAQENTPMRVLHCSAVDQQSSIQNIYIDEDNKKFIATQEELFRLYSADNASSIPLEEDQWYALMQNDGNANLNIAKEKIETIIQPASATPEEVSDSPIINVAHFDAKNNILWVGTAGNGLFAISITSGNASLIKHYTKDDSKLKSNHINAILKDKYARLWVGTDQGILLNQNEDDWKLYEKREKILEITSLGPDVWILGEGILWMINADNRWIPGDVDPKLFQGAVRDIQYDSEGRLWVASEVITRYDVEKDKVEIFDASKGFTSKNVHCIRVDQEDALWVGTKDKGLFLIEKESVMTVSVEVDKGIGCKDGANTGSVKVKVLGGQSPYKYRWKGNQEGNNPQGLGPGVYTVLVSDASGQTRQASAKIEGANISATASLIQEESGPKTLDGVVKIKAKGGAAGYKYLWDNGETSATARQLGTGNHTATVTDRGGCSTVVNIEVTQAPEPEPEPEVVVEEPPVETIPEAPTVTKEPEAVAETSPPPPPAPKPEVLAPLVVSLETQGTNNCPGDENVALIGKVSGGKAPYNYEWNKAGLSGPNPKNLGSGEYQLIVTDSKGNKKTAQVKLPSAKSMKLLVKELEPASEKNSRDGQASLAISGGNGSYVILWDNGETRAKARKLNPGKHTVSVSDANGCEATASIKISQKIIAALNVKKIRQGQTIRMEQLYFDADSTNLKTASEPVLQELFTFLKSNPQIKVEIGGHTNDVPEHEYCDRLSTERAKSIVDYLVKQGITNDRLTYKGYGKRKPLVSNRTAEGRRKNQRVEIKILKLGG